MSALMCHIMTASRCVNAQYATNALAIVTTAAHMYPCVPADVPYRRSALQENSLCQSWGDSYPCIQGRNRARPPHGGWAQTLFSGTATAADSASVQRLWCLIMMYRMPHCDHRQLQLLTVLKSTTCLFLVLVLGISQLTAGRSIQSC